MAHRVQNLHYVSCQLSAHNVRLSRSPLSWQRPLMADTPPPAAIFRVFLASDIVRAAPEAAMQTSRDSTDRDKQREQLYALRMLLEEALRDSNELHHRIREIQLRVAQLSAWVERGDLGGFANVR
jgi:hypothetical protein